MKNNNLVMAIIILLIIVVIFLIVLLVGLLSKNSMFNFFNIGHKVSNELVLDEIYDNIFTDININSDSSDIYIKESSDNNVKVIIYGDKERTTVRNLENKLEIETVSKKCFGICLNVEIARVEVYLPSSYENKIDIKNHYGDVNIDKFSNASIYIDEDCGDVSVREANYLDIVNNYGDIDVEKANTAKIKESCGNVKIREVEDVQVDNNYGDIKIDKINNSLDLKDDCGDIKVGEIDIKVNSFIKNNLGSIKIGSTNNIYIDANTDLGKIKINKNDRSAPITLRVDNDCGDIKIDN